MQSVIAGVDGGGTRFRVDLVGEIETEATAALISYRAGLTGAGVS